MATSSSSSWAVVLVVVCVIGGTLAQFPNGAAGAAGAGAARGMSGLADALGGGAGARAQPAVGQRPAAPVGDAPKQDLSTLQERLKEVKGPIDLLEYVKPVPDSDERRHSEKGDYPPYMIDGRKALIVSVLLKNWEMFNWTLAQGVDINDRDDQGRTLFSLLLGLGAPIESLEELIYRGADPRVPDFKKRTVVHQAISSNNAPALNFLLDRLKLNVNSKDAEGNTALHYAVSLGNMAATWRILETWGGDVNASNNNGINALHLVCNHVNITDRPTIPILVLLFRYNIEKELRSLIDGNTPLHVCAMNGHKPLVTAITKFVQNTATSNYQGYTPAMLAALNGHGDLGRELYKRSEAPVQQWTEAQLGEYIFFEFPFLKASRRLDLMHRFFVYRIDGSQLPQVSNEILAGMGINDPQYRELLLKIFEKLLSDGPAIFNPLPAATQEKPADAASTEQPQEKAPQQPDLARDAINLRERVQPIEL